MLKEYKIYQRIFHRFDYLKTSYYIKVQKISIMLNKHYCVIFFFIYKMISPLSIDKPLFDH